jgi:hypothetical protein
MFRKLDLFRPKVRGRKNLFCWVQGLKLALSKGPNRVGVFLPSSEKRSIVRNDVISSI